MRLPKPSVSCNGWRLKSDVIPFIFAFTVCGALNWGYAYALAFLAVVVACPVFRRRPITLNFILSPDFWLLAAFGVSFVVLTGLEWKDVQNYLLLPLAAYAMGWCASEQGRGKPTALRDHILAIALGFGLYACLNFSVNLGNDRYQLVDFWTGSFRTATGSGFLNTMLFSIAVYSVFLEKRKAARFLLLTATAVCLLYMFILGTRTQIVILAATFLLGFLLLNLEQNNAVWTLRSLAGMLCLAALVMAAYATDFLGLAQFVERSNLLMRFTQQKSILQADFRRLADFSAGLQALYDHPFGSSRTGYFHNLWLDVGRMAGIIPFVFMLCYHIRALAHGLWIFADRQTDQPTRYLALLIYCGVLLNFFVEPVLEGIPNFFLAFCIINGLVDSYRFFRKNHAFVLQHKNWQA